MNRRVRIDKFVSLTGYTRSEARIFLRSGRVEVDGAIVRDAAFSIDESAARVRLDGTTIAYNPSLHLMLHKPAGVVTAASDARRETVMDLLPRHARAQNCMPVGRLDVDTEGLLLFTTDGQLAHRLLSPKRLVEKRYRAVVDAPLSPSDVDAFARGLCLSDFTAMPAALDMADDPCVACVTLTEGKYHQVKRMFAARGRHVLSLTRLSFGGVRLDPALAAGSWRALTPAETEALYRAAGMAKET
jgi:16S rRNA pseudouridine516 synthase